MTVSLKTNHPFGKRYAQLAGALSGESETWVGNLRQTAQNILHSNGLPTRKVEAWKYTSLTELAKTPFIPAAQADDVDISSLPVTTPLLEGSLRFVFVNGVFRADLSPGVDGLAEGCVIRPLSDALTQSAPDLRSVLGSIAQPDCSPIAALNTAFAGEGIVIDVADGLHVEQPIHCISIGASGALPGSFHPRNIIRVGRQAQITIVESHRGLPGQTYLTNPVTEVMLESDSLLHHFVIAGDDSDGSHLGRTDVSASRNSQYRSFVLSMGGFLTRREVRIELHEDGAEATVDGAYGVYDAQHSDIHSEILHMAPHTVSQQTMKGVLSGRSKGVFQGRIHVTRAAQGTDGRQLHKALLLNQGPEVDCKPELEIYADDVQCAHGATTGEVDSNQIFYLMSRGIDEQTARALLIEGFLDDVVLNIAHPASQQLILDTVKSWLAAHTYQDGAGS